MINGTTSILKSQFMTMKAYVTVDYIQFDPKLSSKKRI
jgi:hypothetical protein